MKNAILTALAALFLSCNGSDPCTALNCQNGAECESGACICPEQYEGPECSDLWKAKMVGSFSGLGTCNNGNPTNQSVLISSGASPDRIQFDNGFFGRMITPNQFEIPNQIFTDSQSGNQLSIVGSGTYEPGPQTITMMVVVAGQSCTYQITRQ
jgi:hypothetical protein